MAKNTCTRRKLVYLLLGTFLLPFYNGRWTVSAASWLAFVFIVRFYRTATRPWNIICTAAIMVLSSFLSFNGVVPLTGWPYYLILTGMALVFTLPFIIDSFLYTRVCGFKATLVLPLVGVAVEYLFSLLSPFATFGSLAYTQYGNLPLMQLASLTGIWGISFLLYWFYSAVNWLWESGFKLRHKRAAAAAVVVVVFTAVWLHGGVRLAMLTPSSATVKIAGISTANLDLMHDKQFLEYWKNEDCPHELEKTVETRLRQLHQELLLLTEREARAGAKLIMWHEAGAQVFGDDETELVESVRTIARTYSTYILASYLKHQRGKVQFENKSVMVTQAGSIAYVYRKAHPVPGESSIPGEEVIPYVDTPYGRIGSVICFDADFPGYLRQAGRQGLDILLIPASDWREISPLHTHMAVFRAVENGVSIVRQTNHGLSLAANHLGQTLAAMDYFTATDRVMVAHVPTRGATAPYKVVGDAFAWLCILAFGRLVWASRPGKQ